MSVTLDILRSYRRPREVMRRQLAGGERDDRALVYLIIACALIFVAQLPLLAREAYFHPEVPLEARMGGALLGWMAIAPLMFYVLAAVSHLLARVFGGRGSWFSARLALFWALLATTPLWLLQGLVAGLIGAGMALNLVGGLLAGIFLFIWGSGLFVAEKRDA